MAEDYYADTAEDEQVPTGETAAEEGADEAPDEQDEGSESFLVPKSAFSGEINPGDKFEVKIVRGFEDEVEVRIVGAQSSEDAGEDESSMMSRMRDMDRLVV